MDETHMLKNIFMLAACCAAFNVQAVAVMQPLEISREYRVAVGFGGATIFHAEDAYQSGPVKQLAQELIKVPSDIEISLNNIIAETAAADGATFLGGSLQGNPLIQVAPQANGTALMTLSGVGYHTAVRKKYRKLGITWFSCTANLSVTNVLIKAQYGSNDGQFRDETVGFNGNPMVNTDCDSFLSWLLPGIGNYLTNSLANLADRRLLDGIKLAMGRVKDKLFFRPDENLLRGLNTLIPQNKTIQLPNGSSFPIGQYVRDNIAYLVSNSTFTMEISRGLAPISTWAGFNSANVLYLALNSPLISLDLLLTEQATVEWHMICEAPEGAMCP
jgi:hypothetical protein